MIALFGGEKISKQVCLGVLHGEHLRRTVREPRNVGELIQATVDEGLAARHHHHHHDYDYDLMITMITIMIVWLFHAERSASLGVVIVGN